MVESVRDRARAWWAVGAATVTLLVAVVVVGIRQALRVLWAHTH